MNEGVCYTCGAAGRLYTDPETDGAETCIRCQFRRWEAATPATPEFQRAKIKFSPRKRKVRSSTAEVREPRPAADPKPPRKPPKPRPAPKPKPPRIPRPAADPKPRRKRKRREHRERYAAAALCVRCGAERDRPDRLNCARCLRLAAEWSRRRANESRPPNRTREGYLAAGLCGRCGGERDDPDRRTCTTCRRRASDWARRQRVKKPPDAKRINAARRELCEKRRAAGLCRCGASRDRPDRLNCARCRKRDVDTARFNRARRRGAASAGCASVAAESWTEPTG